MQLTGAGANPGNAGSDALVRVLVRMLVRVRVRVQAWVPVMGAGASVYMGGTIEGTDADTVAV